MTFKQKKVTQTEFFDTETNENDNAKDTMARSLNLLNSLQF